MRPLMTMRWLLGLCFALLVQNRSAAQCGATIATFPYQEGFEAGPSWTSGGTNSDWAWGIPAHPLISTAGEGLRSWCVGGLTGSFYNYSQQSWLVGPCFDFSALQYPVVSFRIFWECERTYDGLGFQYSLDGGTTWANAGSMADAPDCLDANWFNAASITNLNQGAPGMGWSGRVGATVGACTGGQGSGQWVTASQCLAFLAGEPSVRFRFVFGAGSTCNSYDGVAIDDVRISEAPIEQDLAVQYTCFGDTLSITGMQTCAESWVWDFDDPASGAANTSTDLAPSHVFSAPGSYEVSVTLSYGCRSQRTLSLSILILGFSITSEGPSCAGNDGSASAEVTGAVGPVTYTWPIPGADTPEVTGLGAGTYYVQATSPGACPTGGWVTLAPPPDAPEAVVSVEPVTCNGGSDGSASIAVAGGSPPYAFNWAPPVSAASDAVGLPAGTYTCTITDAAACSITLTAVVAEPATLAVTAQGDTAVCAGASLVLEAVAIGGTAPYSFAWLPEGPAITPAVSGAYAVTVTDANGCMSGQDAVQVAVGSVASPSFTMDTLAGCAPLCVAFNTASPQGTLTWNLGDGTVIGAGQAFTHCYGDAGSYSVALTVTDNAGCSATWASPDTLHVSASPVAAFSADPPVTTIGEPEVTFFDLSSGATGWAWTFGDTALTGSTAPSPAVSFPAVGCYPVQLVVSNPQGCTDTATHLLCVEDEFAAWIPNAFTPNGDGFNDSWGIITTVGTPRAFELLVFDRWGGLLFSASEKGMLWDGTARGAEVPLGVYPWRLRLIDTQGFQRERSGHVVLVR